MENKNIVCVNLLGGFTLSKDDKSIPLEYSNTTKMIQLLISVLAAGNTGIPRKQLIDRLYGNDVLEDPAVTLRVNAHRLRKYLKKIEAFGESDCIRIKLGNYFWDRDEVPLELDIEVFTEAIELAQKEKTEETRLTYLLKACQVYKGDFLPELGGEEWVAVACADYQKKYFACLKEAETILTKQNRYEELLELSTKACRLYPYEEFYLLQIDCLMTLGRFKEAMDVYEKATTFYFEELGLTPSDEMMERFHAMSDKVQYHAAVMTDIKDGLQEEKIKSGAYFCTYPGFTDCYHIVCRMLERNGQSAYLMLCTMVDREGQPLTDEVKLEKYMEKLKTAVGSSLRKGDFYTRYGMNQYLILLLGLRLEDCAIIQHRIDGCFLSYGLKARAAIEYKVQPAAEDNLPGEELSFAQTNSLWG
nr:bacterial transcriptional activator domain-containing protein [uncultured Eisenbergiella sp.]